MDKVQSIIFTDDVTKKIVKLKTTTKDWTKIEKTIQANEKSKEKNRQKYVHKTEKQKPCQPPIVYNMKIIGIDEVEIETTVRDYERISKILERLEKNRQRANARYTPTMTTARKFKPPPKFQSVEIMSN